MCGILGKIYKGKRDISRGEFQLALDLMEHRGPDDYGVYENDDVVLGQRRLSIIDLSKNAKQPMISKDGKVVIVFNGEIYNFRELREDLIQKGHSFFTQSDTEVLLNAYYEYGIQCIHSLIGMFAFVIYDNRTKDVFIVRDRLGIKPLFYFFNEGNLTFSSEIKSILKIEDNKSFEPNENAISSYMSFRYPIHNDTFFNDIYSLPAGHFIHVRDGCLKVQKYWYFNDKIKEQKHDKGENFYIKELVKLLKSAVAYRMISDVEIGAFLSGGVDSSLITAIMAGKQKSAVNTFTIGFDEKGYNEFEYANIVAKKYKTNHHEINISSSEYVTTMENLIAYKDSPLSVPNEVPLYLMSKELKKYITVVLSGEGADEIFGGYGRIFRSPKDYNDLVSIENGNFTTKEKMILLKNYNEKYKGRVFKSHLEHFYSLYSYTSIADKNELLTSRISNEHNERKLKDFLASCFNEVENESYYNKIMYTFERVHLQGLLNRVDTTTMAASVEARVPFVDHRLVEFAFTIPVKYKLKWKSDKARFMSKLLMSTAISEIYDTPKYILKKAAESFLPQRILYRKKMGFPVPLNKWFSGDFNSYAKSILLDQKTINRKQINVKNLEKWLHDTNKLQNHNDAIKIWMLINLELFNRRYFDN